MEIVAVFSWMAIGVISHLIVTALSKLIMTEQEWKYSVPNNFFEYLLFVSIIIGPFYGILVGVLGGIISILNLATIIKYKMIDSLPSLRKK